MTTFTYKQTLSGDLLPVVNLRVSHSNKIVTLFAILDSGASVSIFRPSVAKLLGIDITKGKAVDLGGIGGGIKGYLFNLAIELADKTFSTAVVFSFEFQSPFNLLGRDGVFKRFAITFDEKNKTIIFK